MLDKLKNRLEPEKSEDETAEMMHRISKLVGGGAVTLVDADISFDSVRSHETPDQHANTMREFREAELRLNEMRRLADEAEQS
jgi:hypothetical protein